MEVGECCGGHDSFHCIEMDEEQKNQGYGSERKIGTI